MAEPLAKAMKSYVGMWEYFSWAKNFLNDEASKIQQLKMAPTQISIADCPINSVQVYLDRAEITRSIKVPEIHQATEDTEFSIDVTNMVIKAEPESIRVKGNKGAKILEVSNSKKVVAEGKESPEVKELVQKRNKLQDEKTLNRAEKSRLDQSIVLTKKFAETAFERVENQPPKSVQEAREIMEYWQSENARISMTQITLEQEYKALQEQISVVQNEISTLVGEQESSQVGHTSRTVHIKLLRSPASGELEDIVLTYMVMDSRWEPSYDVRINSEKKSMVVTYYAEVNQRSGESWDEVDMLLSTANPSIGSTPKSLQKIIAREKTYLYNQARSFSKNLKKKGGGGGGQPVSLQQSAPPGIMMRAEMNMAGDEDGDFSDDDESTSDLGGRVWRVSQGDDRGLGGHWFHYPSQGEHPEQRLLLQGGDWRVQSHIYDCSLHGALHWRLECLSAGQDGQFHGLHHAGQQEGQHLRGRCLHQHQ